MPVSSDRPLPPLCKIALTLATIWVISCLWFDFASPASVFDLPIVAFFYAIVAVALLLYGTALLIWTIVFLIKSRGRDRTGHIVLAMLFGIGLWINCQVSYTLRWLAQRPHYEKEVAPLKALSRTEQETYCKQEGCIIDHSHNRGVFAFLMRSVKIPYPVSFMIYLVM